MLRRCAIVELTAEINRPGYLFLANSCLSIATRICHRRDNQYNQCLDIRRRFDFLFPASKNIS